MPWYIHLLVAVATLAVSFFLGGYLGKKLRMYDHGWKISVCLFALLASVVVVLMGPPFKLGVDLSGGVILVYEVDQAKKADPNRALNSGEMDKLVAAVARRVNPGGQKEVTIRKYGTEQIEIIIPEVDEAGVQRIERIISRAGNLEFRILANDRHDKAIIEQALANPSKIRVENSQGEVLAQWVPVKESEAKKLVYPEIARRTRKIGDREVTEILVDNDIYNVTGAYLTSASGGTDQTGQPCVNFTFNNTGGQLFSQFTSSHLPDEQTNFYYKLAIILDDEIYSAPRINSTISNRGVIEGNFTMEEVQDLVNVLNAGSLPAALTKEPISKLYSGATLGEDTIQKSTQAMLLSAILVPLFMLWYYRFSGIVAIIALGLNMLMLVSIMLTIKAAFTLTGFAGLALTVGMAVDNNVLVFERLREELERGATLRMAIRNAFHRASTTIIDCNLTHLIAATVLYVVGTDQLRGFAVPLWLGTAISMFTSVFVAHVIFDVAEKRQWITKLKMKRLIGHTDIDFMGMFRYALPLSLSITIMAIGVSVYRGQGLFDIDFTGGTSVQAVFDKPQDTGQVRRLLEEEGHLPDLAISDVRIAVKGVQEEQGLRFNINTSELDLKKVKRTLSQVFGNQLSRNAVTLESGPKLIESDAKAPSRTVPRKPLPSEDVEKGEKGAKPPAGPNPYAGWAEARLKFQLPLNYRAVEELLNEAVEALGMPAESVVFHVSSPNPKFVEGELANFSEWDVQILLPLEEAKPLLTKLEQQVADNPIFPASSTIGGAVAVNTRLTAAYALVASWLGIILYLWVRFQGVAFGLAAVIALVHDVLVMLGGIAISYYVAPYLGFLMIEPFKINLPIIAAFLTIIGYSVNDSIVVFDRIREVRGKDPNLTRKMVNNGTNQTLSRTLLTSVTVFLVVVVLYCFGGEAIHGFAFALLVGVISGTYSSVYVAAPVLLWLVGRQQKEKTIAGRS